MGPRRESAREYGVVAVVVTARAALDCSSVPVVAPSFVASDLPAGFRFEPCCILVEAVMVCLLFAALFLALLIFEDGGTPRALLFCLAIIN